MLEKIKNNIYKTNSSLCLSRIVKSINFQDKQEDYIDIECWNLVRVMNLIPGIKTTSCCCGHNLCSYSVRFLVDLRERGMNLIARCTCPRYNSYAKNELQANCMWKVFLEHGDLKEHQVTFVLQSNFTNREDEQKLVFDRFPGLEDIEKEFEEVGAKPFMPAEKLAWKLENHVNRTVKGYNILYDWSLK